VAPLTVGVLKLSVKPAHIGPLLLAVGVVGIEFTVTFTFPVVVLLSVKSVGVKVIGALKVPVEPGTVDGVVKAKLPGTDATPPVSVEAESALPRQIALAVGNVVMVGVVRVSVRTVTIPVPAKKVLFLFVAVELVLPHVPEIVPLPPSVSELAVLVVTPIFIIPALTETLLKANFALSVNVPFCVLVKL
jgi:hypothetical protein